MKQEKQTDWAAVFNKLKHRSVNEVNPLVATYISAE